MATPRVLHFDTEGRPLEFSVWLRRARRLLESQVQAHETLWAHASDDLPVPADPAPLAADPTHADRDRYAREHADLTAWKLRDAAACIALSSLLLESEETHFTQVRTASEFLTAIKARYATPTTVSLGRLFLPFLFPDLASFERTADLITHLRSLDSSYRAACIDAQLAMLPPPMAITIYFITTSLPDLVALVRDALLLKHPSELTIEVLESALKDVESNLHSVASASGAVPPPLFHECTVPQLHTFTASLATAATDVTIAAVTTFSWSWGRSGRRGGQGACEGGGGGGGDVANGGGGSAGAGGAPRAAAGDSPAAAGGGDARVRHPPIGLPAARGGAAACVGTCVDTSPRAAPEDASLSFTLDSGDLHCFFRDRTTLTPLPTPVSVALADPTSGPVTARYTTTLPCPAVPSSSLTGFHVPLFSRNLVGVRPLVSQHMGVWIEPSGETAVCVDGDTYVPLATFTAKPGSGLYTLHNGPRGQQRQQPHQLLPLTPVTVPRQVLVSHQVAASPQVAASGQASRLSCRHCRLRLRHPVVPALRVGLFPLAKKSNVTSTLIRWLLTTTNTRSHRVSCLHSDRGGVFRSGVLAGFCREQGIRQSWTLPKSPQLNGVAERRLGLVMEIARTSMTHDQSGITSGPLTARAPHFLWPYAVRYAAHQLNLWPRVSRPEASSTSLWTGSPGVALRFCVRGCFALVCDTSAEKISPRVVPCVFLGFPEDSSDYTFYHPPLHRFFDSCDVHLDESVPYHACVRRAREEQLELEREEKELERQQPELQQLDEQHQEQPQQQPQQQQQQQPPQLEEQRSQPQQEQQQQPPPPPISGLRTLSLPAPSPPSPPSPPISSPPLPPPDPSLVVFPPPLSLSSPLLSHMWPSFCSPRARPSSPVPFIDLHTALFRSSPPRSSPSVIPSPPESALTASLSTPVTDYYRTLVAAPATTCLAVGGESALGNDALEFLAAASPYLCAMLLGPEGEPDALDIPTLCTYAKAVSGPWASQWRAAMDSEMASYRSTGTYVDEVPPPGANVVDGMWIFRTFAPTPKMTTLRVLLHVAAQRDYELHSLDFSTAVLQGSLHEEVWLRRPSAFSGTFPFGTQWRLRRPVYGLRQAPREWHDTLHFTFSDLGFLPSSANPSLFVHRGSTPFFVLVYVDDLVFATADRVALADVKLELQKRHTCTDLGKLHHYLGLQITRDRAAHAITLSQSHIVEQVLQRFELQHTTVQRTPLAIAPRLNGPFPDKPFEPSGPYAELLGYLMYLMTCTRPDLTFPFSILARFVEPRRHRPVHWTAAVRVAKYLATTSGMGLVLGGRQDVVLTCHCDSSYADDAETHSTVRCPYVIRTGDRTGQACGMLRHTQSRCFAHLSEAWHTEFGDEAELPTWLELLGQGVDIYALDYDAILTAMYALPTSADRACYLCVPPDPGIAPAAPGAGEAAALGASVSPALGTGEAAASGAGESALSGTALAEALYPFTLDSGASRSFFRDSTTLTPLSRPVPVSLADPSGGPVRATSSTVLPCPAVPSGTLSGLYLLSFSTNLVAGSALQDAGQLSPPCSCRALSHQTLLWHHRLGHPLVQRLRSMHHRVLVLGLPRVLSPLPPSPAPLCLPCVEGRQRAAPHSSSFPPTEAPLQTLHLDVWGPARVCGQGHERYFLLVVDDYTRYTTLRERFGTEFPVMRLHSVRGGEFSSDLLAAFCAEHGIRQTFTLPASPQQNGVAERRIGLVMEVARTSMIHAAAPHFFRPFAVRYATHQLNLWPRVSLPETSPTLLFTNPPRAVSSPPRTSCSTSRFPFTVSSPTALPLSPPPPLFFAPGAPQVDPLPAPGPAPSGVSQVDPPPLTAPVEVTGDSGPAECGLARGTASGGAESGGAEPGGAETGGAEPGREESRGAEPGGTESGGAAPGGAEASGRAAGARGPAAGGASVGVSATGVVSAGGSGAAAGAGAGGSGAAEGAGAGGSGAAAGAGAGGSKAAAGAGAEGSESANARSPWSSRLRPRVPLTSQQLHDWYGRHQGRASGARGSTAGGTSAGVTRAGSGAGPGGARTGDPGAAGAEGAELGGAPAGDPGSGGAATGDTETGDPGTGGAGSEGAAAGGAGPGRAGAEGSGAAGGAGATGGAGAAGAGGAAQPRMYIAPPSPSSQPPSDSVPRQVLSLPSSTGLPLQPGSPLPAPSPYTEQTGGLTERREPASRPVLLVRSGRPGRRVPRSRQPAVTGTHLVVRRPSSPPQRVPLPSPPASSLPTVPEPESDRTHAAHSTVTHLLATVVTDPSFESAAASALVAELDDIAAACRLDYAASLVAESESIYPPSIGGDCALGTDVLEDRQEDLECLIATAPHLVSMLLAPEGDPDAPDIPTPRSYAEAIAGTYVDEVPPPGANIVSGMWIFRVKRPPGSPPVFKARYVARGLSQREGVEFFQTFSPTLKMTTLRVLLLVAAQRDYALHSLEFSAAFLQGSLHEEIWLRRPLGYTGSFLPGTLWSLRRPVYGLHQAPHEWHDTLRTTLAALGFAPSTADPSLFLRTDTLLPPFYILVYVDDLVFATADTAGIAHVKSELQKRHTCTDLGPSALRLHLVLSTAHSSSYRPLALSSTFERVPPVVRLRSTPQPCELRWLTYLLTNLREWPRSPPVLYVENKAAIALCQEHRLEHRTKHIALHYFLARELQQRGQLCLAHVATQANTADIFTKALPSGDHQRFCTLLGLVPTLPHLL
ncbi:unnamed protein product [Closterium sp. NIES-53]